MKQTSLQQRWRSCLEITEFIFLVSFYYTWKKREYFMNTLSFPSHMISRFPFKTYLKLEMYIIYKNKKILSVTLNKIEWNTTHV